MKQALLTIASFGAVAAASIGTARADLVLTGPDSNAGSYSVAALSSAATASDAVSSAGLSGISLWGLLGGAAASSPTSAVYGGIATSTPAGDNAKNAILRYYLIATSTSGAQSVVSLGEIDPTFGGTAATPAFLATSSSGSALAAPELVVAGAPARDLANVASLQLVAAPALPTGAGGVSTSLALSGNTANAGTYTAAALQSDFIPVIETVSGDTYTGAPLFTFLNPTASDVANQIVVAGATDGYEVVYSLAELDPALNGNAGNLLPYADSGTNFPSSGVARTILPNDNAHGRWESNLNSLQVLDVPEPGTLSILGAALISLAMIRRARLKRSP